MINPLIQEVREAREALAAKFDFDLHRIFEDAMKREAAEHFADLQKIPTKRTAPRAARSISAQK
jgi:hypothetical protein